MKSNEDGEIEHVIEIKEYKVFHRIYLSLQEDEVELAKPAFFRELFNDLLTFLSTE
jgi:DNA primase